MRKKVKQLISHPLFSGSMVMIFGTNAVNILNYVYHVIMARLLVDPILYGELATLFSLVGLLGVVTVALNLVVVKYISSAQTKVDVSALVNWFGGKVLLFAAIILVVMSLVSPLIASFLQIKSFVLVILVTVISAFSLLTTVNRGILQGLLRFNQTVMTILVENGVKLLLGVALVYIGFAVGGAMVALVAGGAFAWLLSRSFLGNYFGNNIKNTPDVKSIFAYFLPVFVQSIAITSLYSTDLVLVKHFFKPYEAGLYAATSTLGKIIYFGASPISLVMFPLVSKKFSKGQSFKKVFFLSLVATVILAVGVLGIFRLFPQFAVVSLFGSSYLQAASLLFGFGVFMVFYTLSVFLINFHLSLKRIKVVVFPLLAAVVQAVGIWLYHSNLESVIMISAAVSGILFTTLLAYSFFER